MKFRKITIEEFEKLKRLFPDNEDMWIKYKKYQGQGLGQKLIKSCIDYLTNIGYTEFTIGVEEDNEIAKHIYFKFGFNKVIDKGHGDEFAPGEYTLY